MGSAQRSVLCPGTLKAFGRKYSVRGLTRYRMSEESGTAPTADRPFHVMTKPNGPSCNLECEYCFYLEKEQLYPERADFAMSEATLESFVRQYIEAQPGPAVTFAWQGGEPTLLGVDFFRKAVQFQEKHAPDGMRIQNTIQTNGTLLDEEWCEFLAANDFLVGISVDGPRRLHDRFRRTRGDTATFDDVMRGLSLLQDYGVEHNALCVVNAVNSRHPREVYEFFKRQGEKWIQFIPLVESIDTTGSDTASDGTNDGGAGAKDAELETTEVEECHEIPKWVRDRGGDVRDRDDEYATVVAAARNGPVSERSVDPVAYGEFVCTIFDEWVRNDLGDVSVRLFDQCLEQLLNGTASLCVFSETCGSQVAIEHNGDVYACDHFVDPGFERGNIHETHLAALVDDPEQQQFGEYKRDGLPERCRTCDVQEFCRGGCPKNWLLETPAGRPGLNYLCPGYRRFFTYIQPYLDVVEQTLGENYPLPVAMERIRILDDSGS